MVVITTDLPFNACKSRHGLICHFLSVDVQWNTTDLNAFGLTRFDKSLPPTFHTQSKCSKTSLSCTVMVLRSKVRCPI